MKKRKAAKTVAGIFRILALACYFIFMVAPIAWMLLTSLKPVNEIVTFPIRYLPEKWVFENYVKLFSSTNFALTFRNSAIVSVSVAVLTTFFAVLAGYAFSRFEFKAKRACTVLLLVTQMVPIVIIIVPMLIIFAKIRLIDTLFGLILVFTVLNIPFCTLLIKGFFQRIPVELEESSMLDGCSRLQGLMYIILPIMRPGIASTMVFAFIGAWNDLFFGIMFINSEANRTIPVGINLFIGKYEIDWGGISAATIIALIPVFIMFGLIQKHLVSGLTSGAVKG